MYLRANRRPAELAAFLQGEPPIVIGFGSMTGFDAVAMTRAVVAAVRGLERKVVLQSGWAGLGDVDLPPNVIRAGFVPHAWLHERAACVVHHGGAGTTASALRAKAKILGDAIRAEDGTGVALRAIQGAMHAGG
jgi:UDP:flavonoid glycosyltransferase YjiC (YdhE family)